MQTLCAYREPLRKYREKTVEKVKIGADWLTIAWFIN
jgi:hypothetical protein